MMEKWNDGMASYGQFLNARGGGLDNSLQKMSLSHYSIIPVENMQDGWGGILYYQQFVEFPRHVNMMIDKNFTGKKIAHELSRINRKKISCKFV